MKDFFEALLAVAGVVVLPVLMWLGTFMRRDGALPFLFVFPIWFISAFLAVSAGVIIEESSSGPQFVMLLAPSAGWISSLLFLRLSSIWQVTWADSLLIASAGWMPLMMGVLYLLTRYA